ncbi:D-amino acid dehydrogenase [Brevundimonas sp.]|uniref:D-amino acid dehydrogenase n=1 Tax=Brevundimonas sp. TaxID=1871086 RepID=UPI003784F2C2
MKVLVLGAGVIGVTTAYYLARAGHEVTVVERQPGPALETSFANAGQVSPGYSSPWAAPSIPRKAPRWLLMKYAPLILRPRVDPAMIQWGLAMLRNCTPSRYVRNKERMVRLAEYSRDQLMALRAETGIAYDGRAQGTLQLFRTERQLEDSAKDVKVLNHEGVPCEVLDKAGCIAAEPGLARSEATIVGGLRLPNDETGDCHIFTNRLAEMAAALGVVFRFNETVEWISTQANEVTAVRTDKGDLTADAYVVALGSYSTRMLKPLGLGLPVYPVKGYSITVPIADEPGAPVSTVMDETYKIAITRLGDRIRVGGMAELGGYSHDLPPHQQATLEHSLTTLFPGAGDVGAAKYWTGLRPMTPDGTPVIGRTKYKGLWLSTGHGTLGWTMACGSGRVLADLISGVKPEVETADLEIARYA